MKRAVGLEERYVDLRVFATQDGNGEVNVFPGGLTQSVPAFQSSHQ